MEKKNTGLIVLVIILSLLVLGLSGYIVYDKVLSKEGVSTDTQGVNDNIQVNDNKSEYDESQVLALGNSIFLSAKGIINSFNSRGAEKIYNYDSVSKLFTDVYIKDVQDNPSKYHICWPVEKEKSYYNNENCGFGGSQTYTYKSISIKEYNENKIVYTVLYDLYSMDIEKHENVEYDFEVVLEDNVWKINTYYGF